MESRSAQEAPAVQAAVAARTPTFKEASAAAAARAAVERPAHPEEAEARSRRAKGSTEVRAPPEPRVPRVLGSRRAFVRPSAPPIVRPISFPRVRRYPAATEPAAAAEGARAVAAGNRGSSASMARGPEVAAVAAAVKAGAAGPEAGAAGRPTASIW